MSLNAAQIYELNHMNSTAYECSLGSAIAAMEAAALGGSLASAHIIVGSGAGVATDVALTGDIAITNLGVSSIAAGVVVNADISAAAAIAFSKLAALADGNILVGNVSNVAASVAVTGDVTINNAGVTAIGSAKVTNAMLAAGTRPSHVVLYAGAFTTVGGDATEVITVSGVASTDLIFTQVKNNGTNDVTVLQAVPTTNTITLTMSGDPSSDAIVYYQVLRAIA